MESPCARSRVLLVASASRRGQTAVAAVLLEAAVAEPELLVRGCVAADESWCRHVCTSRVAVAGQPRELQGWIAAPVLEIDANRKIVHAAQNEEEVVGVRAYERLAYADAVHAG